MGKKMDCYLLDMLNEGEEQSQTEYCQIARSFFLLYLHTLVLCFLLLKTTFPFLPRDVLIFAKHRGALNCRVIQTGSDQRRSSSLDLYSKQG